MRFKYLLYLSFLFFLSCNLKDESFENSYIKIEIPKGWIITENNGEKPGIWLITTLIPTESKYFEEFNQESPSQNLIIVAKDSIEASTEGNYDFKEFAISLYKHQNDKFGNLSNLQIVKLGSETAYYCNRQVQQKDKETLIQKMYLVKVNKFYLTFYATHRLKGRASDTEKILSNIKFK